MQHKFVNLYLSRKGAVLRLGSVRPMAVTLVRDGVLYMRFALYNINSVCKPLVVEYNDIGELVTR